MRRDKVIRVMNMHAFNEGRCTAKHLGTVLYTHRGSIWKTGAGHAHAEALIIRMIAAGLLAYTIQEEDCTQARSSLLLNWNQLTSPDRYVHEHDGNWRGIELLVPEPESE